MSSAKKVVRVRRTPQSSSKQSRSFTSSFATPNLSDNEKCIIFAPGPVGLQLEPVNVDPIYGCRVVRFVDGGPNNPGQARRSGKIKPGDWVLKVEAEGMLMAATTYEEILQVLKQSHVKRILTVKSMWDESFLGAVAEKAVGTTTMTMPPSSTFGFIPTRKSSSFKPTGSQSSRFTPANLLTSQVPPQIPPSVPEDDVLLSPVRANGRSIDNELVKSPSDMVLLSNSLDDLSRISSSSSRLKSATDGPVIVPIAALSLDEETEIKTGLIEDDVSDGDDSITRSRSPFSEQTTKSSNKSDLNEVAPQTMADQFLLLDGFTGAFVPDSPYVSSRSQSLESTVASGSDESSTSDVEDEEEEPTTPVQALSYSPRESRISDSARSQLQHQQELLDRSLLRADFEQRLQSARMEYSKTERELKELYIQTCERNEVKIRELQTSKSSLKKKVKELEESNRNLQEESTSRSMELDMSKTMVKELESRMVTLESEKNATAIRFNKACDSIQELEIDNAQKDQAIFDRESDIKNLELQVSCLKDELDAEKKDHQEAITNVSILTKKLDGATFEAEDYRKQLEAAQSQIESVEREIEELKRNLKVFEKEKAEALALAESLSQSVQEKQKALVAGRSIVARLESENENLTQQIRSTNDDVENLLKDKLALEDKFAETWKDFQQAKDEASTIHETLLEKLENGEFFTASDIQEKQNLVDAMKEDLHNVKATSFEEIVRQKKASVNFQIEIRSLEHLLFESQNKAKDASSEKDQYCDALTKVKGFVELARQKIHQARIESEEKNQHILTVGALLEAKAEREQELLFEQVHVQDRLTATEKDLAEAQQNFEQALKECQSLSAQKDCLLTEFREIQVAKESLEERYQNKAKGLAKLKEKASSAERALSIFAQKLSEAKCAEDASLAQKNEMEREMSAKIESMEVELKILQESVELREMDVQSIKKARDESVAHLRESMNVVEIELKEKEVLLSSAVNKIRELEVARKWQQQEYTGLEKSMKTREETLVQLKLANQDLSLIHI